MACNYSSITRAFRPRPRATAFSNARSHSHVWTPQSATLTVCGHSNVDRCGRTLGWGAPHFGGRATSKLRSGRGWRRGRARSPSGTTDAGCGETKLVNLACSERCPPRRPGDAKAQQAAFRAVIRVGRAKAGHRWRRRPITPSINI